jgi:hypothetical protein
MNIYDLRSAVAGIDSNFKSDVSEIERDENKNFQANSIGITHLTAHLSNMDFDDLSK